ncbi:MAG: polysaccharide deacetylase family protein [Deltaproteobacteria bacterium]|nr:polysaccharide deacetylase family protein [Deltaproteobacteria bacterium]
MFINCFTVDVEDWFHVCGVSGAPQVPSSQWRVYDNTLRLLDLFDELDIHGTFFMLGSVASARPALASEIAARGHEVASHGYSHKLVYELTPDQFRQELVRTGDLIASQTGVAPRGFRAPQWSLGGRTPWAFEILAAEGYLYDSSCTPLPFVGDSKGSLSPYQLATAAGNLWEIPPLVTPGRFVNLPSGGGWGLRFLPMKTILKGVEYAHSAGNPAVIFLHPRDVDPDGPRLALPLLKSFAAYGTRSDATPVLRTLARTGKCIPLGEMVDSWRFVS